MKNHLLPHDRNKLVIVGAILISIYISVIFSCYHTVISSEKLPVEAAIEA